MNRFSNQS